jgi:anti-sigma factor RsiW
MNRNPDGERNTHGAGMPGGTGHDGGAHPDGEMLLMFVEGMLDGDAARVVNEHLKSCKACMRAAQRTTELLWVLRNAGTVRLRTRSAPCPAETELASYADGALCAERRAAVEAHLAVCNACLGGIADLWALEGPLTADAPASSVERVIERLRREPRPASVRWAGRTLKLVRGFVEAAGGFGAPAVMDGLEPALATAGARDHRPEERLEWTDGRGVRVAGRIELTPGGPALSGFVTHEEAPAATVSVRLTNKAATRGPESLDVTGHFGPWPLSVGSNVLHLTGLPNSDEEAIEFEIVVSHEEPIESETP